MGRLRYTEFQTLPMAVIHAEEDAEDRAAKRPAKPRAANRGALPKHLPRIEEVIEPDSLICGCGGCLHCIGEDVSERLDIVPAQFRVIVTRRPRYACTACRESIVQAPAPARLIEAGLPTEALLAHVAVSKYADGLPLYRQEAIYARDDVAIVRNVMAGWMGRAAVGVAGWAGVVPGRAGAAASCAGAGRRRSTSSAMPRRTPVAPVSRPSSDGLV